MGRPRRLLADMRGASAAEYAILLGLVGVAMVTAALTLTENIVCSIDDSASIIGGAQPSNGHQYGHSNPQGKAKGHHPGC